jgi:two-component system sensor histidine kinase YesM
MSTKSLEQDYIHYQERLNVQIVKTLEENIKNLTRQSMAIYANLEDTINWLANTDEARNTEYLADYNRVSNYLYSLLQSNEKLYAVTLLSLDGDILYYSSKQGSSINLYNVQNEPWFMDTIALKGMPLLIEPHLKKFIDASSPNNKSVISISRTIINLNTSQPIGMIMFDQDIAQFSKIVADIEWDNNQNFVIVGKSGSVIYSDGSLDPVYYEKLATNTSSKISGSFKLRTESDTLLVNFSESPDYEWKVISAIPLSELQKKSHFLRDINYYLLIVLILFAFVLSLFFSYIVNKPLKRLLLSLRKLGKGDFNTRIIIKGEDELSQIGVTFNAMVQNIESLIQQNLQIGLLRKQAELESLQSQINPHFLFNTLTSILSVLDKRDYEKSSMMIKSLSDMFRYSLNKGKFIVPFSEELEHINKYLYIQECRFAGKYRVIYDIDDEVRPYGIVRLSLQPIIENAIIHGIEPKVGSAELKITAKAFGDKFYVYITDTGIGIEASKLVQINESLELPDGELSPPAPSDKLGIINVDRRIKLHFGPQYGLKLYRSNHLETVVKITLPSHQYINPFNLPNIHSTSVKRLRGEHHEDTGH